MTAPYTVTVRYGYVTMRDYDTVSKVDENGRVWYGTRIKVIRYDNKPSEPPHIESEQIVGPYVWMCYECLQGGEEPNHEKYAREEGYY